MREFTAVSLFCGAGGLDKGFHYQDQGKSTTKETNYTINMSDS